jgi:hypothetical protein
MKLMKYIRAQGYNYKSVVIGANDKGESIRKFGKDLTYYYRFLGFSIK